MALQVQAEARPRLASVAELRVHPTEGPRARPGFGAEDQPTWRMNVCEGACGRHADEDECGDYAGEALKLL